MQKIKNIEQLKLIYRLKFILSIAKNQLIEADRYKRILKSLDFLEKEMKKYRIIGDKY